MKMPFLGSAWPLLPVLAAVTSVYIGIKINLGTVGDLIWVASTGIAAASCLYRSGFLVSRKAVGVTCLFTLIVALSAINVLSASAYLTKYIQQIIYILGGYFIVLYSKRASPQIYRGLIQEFFIFACILTSILSFIQYFFLKTSGINIFVFVSSFAGVSDWIEGYARATGLVRHFNQLAMVLMPGLVFAIFRQRWVLATVISFGILASGSRTGLLYIIIAVSSYAIVESRRKVVGVIVAGAILAGLFAYLVSEHADLFEKRFSFIRGEVDQSTGIRLKLLSDGLTLLYRHPFFGIGFGQVKEYLNVDSLESSFVQLFVETGFIGASIFLAIVAVAFFSAWKNLFRAESIVIMLLVVGFLVQPFFMTSEVAKSFWIIFWLAILGKNRNVTTLHVVACAPEIRSVVARERYDVKYSHAN